MYSSPSTIVRPGQLVGDFFSFMQNGSRSYPSQIVLRITSSDEMDSTVAKRMSLGLVGRVVSMESMSGSRDKASAIVLSSPLIYEIV